MSRIVGGARCALRDQGVFCWGWGDTDGTGLLQKRLITATLRPELGKPAVVAQEDERCGIDARGDVACSIQPFAEDPTVERVEQRLGDAIEIAPGWSSTCALRRGGKVSCWGAFYGESTSIRVPGATGATRSRTRWPRNPVDIALAEPAITIAASANGRTCAAHKSGITCWGGIDFPGAERLDDLPIPDAVGLALGNFPNNNGHHGSGCAVRRDGGVTCWGPNHHGERGTGAPSEDEAVTSVPGVVGALAVTYADATPCALLRTGRVVCWGENTQGQIGDGTLTPRPAPTPVMGLTDAISISGGHGGMSASGHTCAERRSGRVVCWGDNHYGDIGDGTATFVPHPTTVVGLDDAVEVAAGSSHTCARRRDGKVWCWGEAAMGNTILDASHAVPSLVTSVTDAVHLAAGHAYSCAVTRSGQIPCFRASAWGTDATADTVGLEPFTNVKSYAAGAYHSCAIQIDGNVVCNGDNTFGQIGVGANGFDLHVRTLPFAKGVVGLSLGVAASCGITRDGGVLCWGLSRDANGPTRRIPGVANATQVSVGDGMACALQKSGEAMCWGERARKVRGLTNAIQVSTGTVQACAVLADHRVACWEVGLSMDDKAQTGQGPFNVAQVIDGLSDVASISVGALHACAVLQSGKVACWGDSDSGQLGIGPTDVKPVPTEVAGLP